MIPRRWFRLVLLAALVASLLANVFLLGYVLRGQQELSGLNPIVENVAAAYPAEVRSEFRRILRENWDRVAVAVKELREARSALSAATKATPFDEAKVRSAMTDVRSRTDMLQGLLQEFLLEALKRLRN